MSDDEKDRTDKGISPLVLESIWLKQHQYEDAETFYHTNVTALVSDKTGHLLSTKTEQSKEAVDLLDKKVQTEGLALLKNAKTIWTRLEEIEKAQNNKTEVIKDIATKLATAVEEYEARLSSELAQNATQLSLLKSLLTEVEATVNRTNHNLTRKKWGSFKTHEEYCQAVTASLAKLGLDLSSCFSLFSSSQADIPKIDINYIVGEINKISIFAKKEESEQFLQKKSLISNEIKLLMKETGSRNDEDSDTSLEGSCSGCSDDSGDEINGKSRDKKNAKQRSGVRKINKIQQGNKQPVVTLNRNNANNIGVGNKFTASAHSGQNAFPMPVKRNAQGAQNIIQRQPDLFQFRGVPSQAQVPFLNQPGLLGPRPNTLPMQAAKQQVPFRFSSFSNVGSQQIPSAANSAICNMNPLSALGQPHFGGINFNFSSSQPNASSFNFGRTNIAQNSLLASMGVNTSSSHGSHPSGNISNQMKQSKLQQLQQSKNAKVPEQLFGTKSGFLYPTQQNSRASHFLQNSQAGVMGAHPFGGLGRQGTLEQQLNEMTQKIQQMQLATSQNLHLQQLMRETERLKQLVAQKQHQQQDQFKHQFQLLINAFMQQQQQFHGPQSKMARSVQFYNSQKLQQRNIHNRQQQIKRQKPQNNKVLPVKQETCTDDSLLRKNQQVSLTEEAGLQNREEDLIDKRKIIGENSKVTRIGTFSPHAHGDKHRAGVSSVVVMENIGCVVVVDIINSCLKLYSVTVTGTSPLELSHHLVTCLELSRPYYMSKLSRDLIVVSREGKILSVVRVSKNKLECLHDLNTESQYYGLGYVKDHVIVCAAFADNKIDLLNIQGAIIQSVTLLTQCKGPELVAAVPSTGYILYLERVVNETVHLLGISQKGCIDFSVDLESSPADVWSIASINDRIICCSKESGKIKLFDKTGTYLTDVNFPAGSVNQPFAMAFCDSGNMYIANDGAWDREYEHYVTTEINVYAFS